MKYGFVLPFGDARTAADLAFEAESAGWDGFFVWEPVWGNDAWISLAAAAMRTERIRLGTLLSPLSRMRPWKIASEVASLDNLSSGRVILSVGLGAVDTGFENFGEVTDRKTRAELLDESLDIMTGLWRGQPFNYQGKHYKVTETSFMIPQPPVQQPRVPIWVVGLWPSQKSMARVVRYDGVLPAAKDERGNFRLLGRADIEAIGKYVNEHMDSPGRFDIVVEGETPGDDPVAAAGIAADWEKAGATWWIEALWNLAHAEDGLEQVTRRVRQGPPSLATRT